MIGNSTETIPRKRAGSDKEEKTRKKKKEYIVELPEVQEEQLPSPRFQPGATFKVVWCMMVNN